MKNISHPNTADLIPFVNINKKSRTNLSVSRIITQSDVAMSRERASNEMMLPIRAARGQSRMSLAIAILSESIILTKPVSMIFTSLQYRNRGNVIARERER